MQIKTKRGKIAASELVGTSILLMIAVSVFSGVYHTVLSEPGPSPETYVTIAGMLEPEGEEVHIAFENRRGESLSLDSIIYLTIAGIRQPEKTIGDILENDLNSDGLWNIGERLIIPDKDVSDLQVEATIVDSKTNEVVMWGILQEGYIEPAFGRGGIWHLDEGTGNIAHDSSGNNNHGELYGSNWITGKNNSAVMFNSEPTDYIKVFSGPGLYITDEITVETWIKPIDTSGGIIDSFEFDEGASGITWIHISGDIFAFAYWHPGQGINCRIQTVNLAPSGQIGDKSIDYIDFIGKSNGFDPDFIHIAGSVYALAHRFQKDNGYVTTINIFDNGSISNSIIDRVEFEPDPSNVFNPDIIHISGDIYAIVSSEKTTNGKGNIATLEIAPNGTINENIIDRFEFEADDCSSPRICKIYDNNYIIAYSSSDNGYINTIKIENNGIINKTIIDSFEFETNRCFETDLEYVASNFLNESNIYAIAYRGRTDNGYIATVEAKNNGTITKNIICSLKFDPSVYGGQPDIERIDNNHTFSIAYLGPSKHGYLTTIKILDNGTILDNIIDTIQFTNDQNNEMEPTIVHVSGYIYGIAYKGKAGKGYLISVSINEGGEIEGTQGIGGIFKDNSYALIANATRAFATINNVTINATGIVSNNWNHIALTYDGLDMCLYINNDQNSVNISYQYPYNNNKINFTEYDNLYFGYLFYGSLDEIAIFDRALSPQEIYNHYSTPGYFEEEP